MSPALDPGRTMRRQGNPALTLVAVCFGLFMVGLDSTVVSIANPAIAADLHTSFGELQWITNSYLLALAVFLILGGKLGDRFGYKRLYLIGIVGFGLTSLGIAVIGTSTGVIILRAAQGAAAAIMMPQTLALLRSTFPRERFGMAVGVWGGVSSVAIAAGPIISGALIAATGWQSVFLVNIPIAVVGVVFGLVVIRDSRPEPTGRFDLAGVVLLGFGLFTIVFGVVQSEAWGWASMPTIGSIGLGVVMLIVFGLVESRVRNPLLPVVLLRSPRVSIGGLVFVANFFAMLGSTFLLTLFLLNTRGDGTLAAGLKMLPLSGVSIIAAPLGAMLVTRIGARLTASLGLLLIAAALITLTLNDADSSYLWMAVPFVVFAIGSGIAIPSGADVIIGGAPVQLAGVAGGFQTTCIQIGGALGTSVLAAVVSARVGAGVPGLDAAGRQDVSQGIVPAQLPSDLAAAAQNAFVGGLHVALIVAAVFAAAIAALTFFGLRRRTATAHVSLETVIEETAEGAAGSWLPSGDGRPAGLD